MIGHIREQEEGRGGKWERLSGEEVLRVKALMRGDPDDERRWEFEVISNKTNGIDAERLDQFRRDAFYLGAKKIFIDH
jgi:HD superfamily phosphohydrolase